MDIKKATESMLNRRSASRITAHADLFYHKITPPANAEEKLDFGTIIDAAIAQELTAEAGAFDPLLPESYSQENDTLKVNISASGISFTCEEALTKGDPLMLRILLLSSMTVITVCAKVAHSKPSNPYETDQYPYLVGAEFVNLKPKDTDLLHQYIHKKRTQAFTLYGLLAILLIGILSAPDLALELLLNFLSFLLESSIDLVHLCYEIIESNLDHLVESIFHTSHQTTNKIVFYISCTLGLAALYPLSRSIFSMVKKGIYQCRAFYYRKKSSIGYYWQEQSTLYHVEIISIAASLIICYVMFFI